MNKLNVLLLGSGGREHAIAWKLSQSARLGKLYISPGNPGTKQHGTNIELGNSADFKAIEKAVKNYNIDLIIVGPEQPLVDGIEDELTKKGILVFGPSKAASQLEGSKSFAKKFMEREGIPTAEYQTFTNSEFDKAASYIKEKNKYPVVLKADGLAGGKGVFICMDEKEVSKRLQQLSQNSLKDAATKLVVEEFMEGEEASVFVIADGDNYKVIHNAQDHKRVGEGDTGLNTGGMGAYAPAPLLTDKLKKQIDHEITRPTIEGMKKAGNPYKGILYIGLMITDNGPKVVEYNCRFGDPECQVILPPLKNDLLELIFSASQGKLYEADDILLSNEFYCTVVLSSGGYPAEYKIGKEITGVEDVDENALIFHAGTKESNGKLITSGGRVLNIVGRGETLQKAIDHTYKNVSSVTFENCYYRRDIGKKGLIKLV